MIHIALLDDQALVLKGLSALLRSVPGIDVALESTNAEQLLHALERRAVDVIVSDIRMPGINGFELITSLRERGDTTPVILLTTFDDKELMLAAVDAGAQGFLLKDAAPEDLAEAIAKVAAGDTLLQPVSLGAVRAQRPSVRNESLRNVSLSDREVSILRLVAGGYSNKEIGRSLHLSEGTVKNYITEILAKLDCRDRTHAVLKAITHRLL